MMPLWLQIVFASSYGLIGGSFVTAWLWRIKSKQSVVHGRSKCRHCQKTLRWFELIPVISWALQLGRCRQCRAKVSWQYPITELTTAILFVTAYIYGLSSSLDSWHFALEVSLLWLITVTTVLLFFYDLLWMKLPNQAMKVFAFASLIYAFFDSIWLQSNYQLLFNRLLCAAILFLIFYAVFRIKDGKYLGGGDVKLIPLLGLVLSFDKIVLMLFGASLAGSIVGITMFIVRRASKPIPFGPFLLSSFFIMFVVGDSIVNWYYQLLLP